MENEIYRTKPKKKYSLTFLLPVLLCLGIYGFRQAYLINANGVDTVKAAEGYINDSIISQGIICRDEVLLTNSTSGIVDYLVDDGERVSSGQLIANIYPTYSDIKNLQILRNRENMTEDLHTVSGFLDYGTIDMSVTKKQLSSQLSALANISSTNRFDAIGDNLSSLTLSLNKIGVATGRITDLSGAEAQLQSEISYAKSNINPASANLYSSYTGYFLRTIDGYEKTATVSNFLNMSLSDGLAVIDTPPSDNFTSDSYGKIVTDYKWNICTYIDTDQAADLTAGKNIRISTDVKNNEFIKAVIKNTVNLGEKILVVIECSTISSQSVKERIVDCEILFKQYSGIKIPKTALHFVDETMGVYVNFSNLVQFKRITPIFEDENYVVVPLDNTRDNQVKLHDSIIVKGRNLYDGKYL